MLDLYGEIWAERLAQDDEAVVLPPPPREPRVGPAAGAERRPPLVDAAPAASPGSGVTPDAESNLPAPSPGSGQGTPMGSSKLATIEVVSQSFRTFRLGDESLED